MEVFAKRLTYLRNSIHMTQLKLGKELQIPQSSLNRYEHNESSPSYELLVRIADYFDVSLDYLLGRTDAPQGKQFEYKPKCADPGNHEMKEFIEMCFEPGSPMNERLKEALLSIYENQHKL